MFVLFYKNIISVTYYATFFSSLLLRSLCHCGLQEGRVEWFDTKSFAFSAFGSNEKWYSLTFLSLFFVTWICAKHVFTHRSSATSRSLLMSVTKNYRSGKTLTVITSTTALPHQHSVGVIVCFIILYIWLMLVLHFFVFIQKKWTFMDLGFHFVVTKFGTLDSKVEVLQDSVLYVILVISWSVS